MEKELFWVGGGERGKDGSDHIRGWARKGGRVKEQKVDPIVTLQKRDPSQPGYGGTLVCPCEAMVKGENSKTRASAWSH
jgi:hypothetical protein